MATNTTNYTLIKPAVNDPTDADRWGNQLNEDLDDIDSELYEAQYGTASYAVSSGAAPNTYEVAYTPAITAYTAGLTLVFRAHQANTGASTLNVNGLGAISITKDVTAPLTANDIKLDQAITVVYDGTNWQLQSRAQAAGSVINTQGDVITGDSGGAAQRLALGALGMSLLSDGTDAVWGFPFSNYQVFTSDDTFTTPAGVTKVMVACWGAGGGGGGTTYVFLTPGAAAGGGGGSGGFSFGIFTPGVTEAVTIGSGGAGGVAVGIGVPGNPGSTGVTSSFGSHCQATGGTGGESGSAIYPLGGTGGVGSGGIINSIGNIGDDAMPSFENVSYTTLPNPTPTVMDFAPVTSFSGKGGNSVLLNGGGARIESTGDGNNGIVNTGGGGSGAHGFSTGPNIGRTGGDGADGLIVVFW